MSPMVIIVVSSILSSILISMLYANNVMGLFEAYLLSGVMGLLIGWFVYLTEDKNGN